MLLMMALVYYVIPEASLKLRKYPNNEARLRMRVSQFESYYASRSVGRMWEMQTSELRYVEGKIRVILSSVCNTMASRPRVARFHIERVEFLSSAGDRAKVYLIEEFADRGVSPTVDLWIYEKNDWYRGYANGSWTVDWSDEWHKMGSGAK